MTVQRRPGGRRRSPVTGYVSGIIAEYPGSLDSLAERCGVHRVTVSCWARGVATPSLAHVERMIELVWPLSRGAAPIYSPAMALDGFTRVGGVGQYTIAAARGLSHSHIHIIEEE